MNPTSIQLGQIATARSGDKGNHANVGVVAYTQAGYDYLLKELTARRVGEFFAGLDVPLRSLALALRDIVRRTLP